MRTLDKVAIEALNEEIEQLQNLDGSDTVLVRDGIVDVALYEAAPIRILWVLKEANDGDGGDWDLKEFIRNNLCGDDSGVKYPRWKTSFLPLIYSAWGILNGFEEWDNIPDVDHDNEDEMIDILKQTAFINLKKFPGGAVADGHEVARYYQSHKSIILRQIDLFQPDIIVACGTLDIFGDDAGVDWDEFDEKEYSVQEGKVFIGTYHPAQRIITREEYVSSIINRAQKGYAELTK